MCYDFISITFYCTVIILLPNIYCTFSVAVMPNLSEEEWKALDLRVRSYSSALCSWSVMRWEVSGPSDCEGAGLIRRHPSAPPSGPSGPLGDWYAM